MEPYAGTHGDLAATRIVPHVVELVGEVRDLGQREEEPLEARRPHVGRDEERHLAVMLEAGDAFVAERLIELPVNLVTLAFHKRIVVVSLEDIMVALDPASEGARSIDDALSNCMSEEVGEYQVIARHNDGWDDVVAALHASSARSRRCGRPPPTRSFASRGRARTATSRYLMDAFAPARGAWTERPDARPRQELE